MMSATTPVLFKEEQQFRQWWFQTLVLGVAALVIVVFAWGMVQQLILDRPFGDNAMSDTALIIMGPLFIVLFGVLFPVFLFSIRMTTEVRPDGLYVLFSPFHRTYRRFPWGQIADFQAVTYNPILNYGGWGIRYGPKGKAYNVSGNRGLRLAMTDGRHVMIGSSRTEELRDVVTSVWKRGDGPAEPS